MTGSLNRRDLNVAIPVAKHAAQRSADVERDLPSRRVTPIGTEPWAGHFRRIPRRRLRVVRFLPYGTLAVFLGPKLFTSGNETASVLANLAVFGVGFCVRPLGAVLFGHLGDLWGRKHTFLATIVIMGVSTTLTGLAPTLRVHSGDEEPKGQGALGDEARQQYPGEQTVS